MKRGCAILLFVAMIALTSLADTVCIPWDASPSAGIAGYRVYYGTNSRTYPFVVNAGNVLSNTVALPQRGRWYFAITAYDTNLVESDFSNEVQYQSRPEAPALHSEQVVRVTPVIERSTDLVNWSAVIGEPTFFATTNNAEFFRTARLTIETLKRIEE
jgi:hypothetical protein